MTQHQQAQAGTITAEMKRAAERENIPAERVRQEVAAGRMVIPANRVHLEKGLKPIPRSCAASERRSGSIRSASAGR